MQNQSTLKLSSHFTSQMLCFYHILQLSTLSCDDVAYRVSLLGHDLKTQLLAILSLESTCEKGMLSTVNITMALVFDIN